ncbi:MAG: hypothetical protein M1834_004383 [Cirrosporium novae-zelandiae]|nr:MAG: hypothetical protein M1834_004383 [Cirrosporium novae-zelandiae]
MATASQIHLSTAVKPQFAIPLSSSSSDESAKKTSELLQDNHEKYHIFFNESGFHNHIVHHLLTLYALGASPSTIQYGYDLNRGHQRPQFPVSEKVVEDMSHGPLSQYLGKEKHYHDFVTFFQREIDVHGCENVVNRFLFRGDEQANDLLGRMFAGFLHPIIHLGFGIEFQQPAIIAEALAQAAVHTTWTGEYLLAAEATATKIDNPTSKSLFQLLDEARADKKLSSSAHWDDGNKIRDGIMVRAPDEMLQLVAQYNVKPAQLEEKTAEMINAAVYFAGAAQRPPKQVKFDFFFMHCVNCSIFFPTFLHQSWIDLAAKCRLLEWKGRLDLAMYVSRRSPDLLVEEIVKYVPKHPGSWEEAIVPRACRFEDDGHASKLVRALANGERVCKPFEEEKKGFRIKGDMWLQLGHMVRLELTLGVSVCVLLAIDSVEDTGEDWVRSAGFDEAWQKFGNRARL